MTPELILMGGFGFLSAGGYLLYRSSCEIKPVYHTLKNNLISINDACNHTELVEIEGTAVADHESGTLTAPFTETDCLAYIYETHENHDVRNSHKALNSGPKQTDDGWIVLDTGTDRVDFVVEDDTGRIRIDPEDAEFQFEDHTYEEFPWRELPGPIAAYIESTDAVEKQNTSRNAILTWLGTNDRRFIEGRLEPGETVYVRGKVRPAPNREPGSVDAVIDTGANESTFVIADTSRRGVVWRSAKSGLVYIAMSVCFLSTGLVIISL